jgi:NodT family efflux transporter outer membrane factor (OMF) lipoprotein
MTLLCGCAGMPNNKVMTAAPSILPSSWRSAGNGLTTDLTAWWEGVSDASLQALINKALERNYDLRAAIERSRQAEALVVVARSHLFPDIAANASGTRQRTDIPPPVGSVTDSQIGIGGSWVIDIFGGNQLTTLAATAQASASVEARRDFEVTLIATISTIYVQFRGLQNQLAILDDTITSRSDTVHLTEVRYRAGLATDLDVTRAETQLHVIEATVPDVQRRIEEDLGALAILTGDRPESIDQSLLARAPIPLMSSVLPARAPAELLVRRPDLRAAARRVDAAAANLGAAKTDLLPKFTLSFGQSIDRLEFRSLPPMTDNLFNIGFGVFWPLFNAGRIHANITAQDAVLRQAEYSFDQTLLNALQDVESAYVDVRAQRERSARLSLALESAHRSSSLAEELYKAGEADFLSVLDAHTQAYDTERDLNQARTDAAVSAVFLYRALGGGWRESTASTKATEINRKPAANARS